MGCTPPPPYMGDAKASFRVTVPVHESLEEMHTKPQSIATFAPTHAVL